MALFNHQVEAKRIIQERSRYAFFWEPGCGKTRAILAGLYEHFLRGNTDLPLKTLVICPKSVINVAWGDEALAHYPSLRPLAVWHSNRDARAAMIYDPEARLLITNFETFKSNTVDFLAAGVKRLVIDESSKLKNHKTAITKDVISFCDKMESVYALSGTPAPNSEIEYWGQIRAIDPRVFADSRGPMGYFQWLNYFFFPIKKRYGNKQFISGWKLKNSRHDEFYDKIKSVSWTLTKDECLDLPDRTDIIREVTLDPKERRAYNSAEDDLCVDDTIIKAEAKIQKLRQIASGFMYDHDKEVQRFGASKCEELRRIITEEIPNEQVVIWAEYKEDFDFIHKLLHMSKANYGTIRGGCKDAAILVRGFQAGNLKYLVCHPQAAGHGLTLTRASYAVYYNFGFSLENHEQSRDRIHRAGQKNHCTYYYLIARDTCEGDVFEVLSEKKTKGEAIKGILTRKGRRN